jgi:L-2-hydroxycarboxylate dehydrogenase (NAD+)
MATSNVSYGKFEIAKREKRPVPIGWGINDQGEHTTNPFDIGGDKPYAMLPIGSLEEHGVHKGYCLCALTDILSAVLGDSAFGPFGPHFMLPETSPRALFGGGLGHLFGAFQVEAFSELESYKTRIEAWISAIKSAKPTTPDQPVLVPGEPEKDAIQDRKTNGIPLNDEVVLSLEKISESLSVPF